MQNCWVCKKILNFEGLQPIIDCGTVRFLNCQFPIIINEKSILTIEPPTQRGEPFLLSGIFCNSEGLHTLLIEENVVKAFETNWDVISTGSTIKIMYATRKICLEIKYIQPNIIHISQLDMEYDGYKIIFNNQKLHIFKAGEITMDLENVTLDGMGAVILGNDIPGIPVLYSQY